MKLISTLRTPPPLIHQKVDDLPFSFSYPLFKIFYIIDKVSLYCCFIVSSFNHHLWITNYNKHIETIVQLKTRRLAPLVNDLLCTNSIYVLCSKLIVLPSQYLMQGLRALRILCRNGSIGRKNGQQLKSFFFFLFVYCCLIQV